MLESIVATDLQARVQTRLFSDPSTPVWAVIDGASCPDLRQMLWELKPEHCCLYSGDLEPDMAEVAPYLVRAEPDTLFLQWLIQDGWGKHWGIFATAAEEILAMRKHFRKFLMVYGPEGNQLLFRYYDPRVLRVYLPTCNVEELKTVFGPVDRYVVEGHAPQAATIFRRNDKGELAAQQENLALT